MPKLPRIIAIFSSLLFLSALSAVAQEDDTIAATSPMRLSYAEGEVSFWRYGAPDWINAQVNTALTAGDSLYVGQGGDLELQMGSRVFIRADDETQLTLINQTNDFLQFKITSGRASFDLRALRNGYVIEVDTPNAVFTIDHVGYYRVDVNDEVHFISRRGGRAIMVPAGGQPMIINPSEEIVVHGSDVAMAETYVAPEIDQWDRWNYDRTEYLLDSVSERYIPAGVSGASDLDQYGTWRVTPDYGPIWVPYSVGPDWVPYSDGTWIWDPYYQWTWVDSAPWGWAPFHYGRWIYLGGYWAWVPGPVLIQPVYSPALVAFFDVGPNVSIGISSPGVGWVALGWGEPLVPWWGPPNFIGRPWWGGWGGPHVVNNVVLRDSAILNVNNINYRNARYNNAVNVTTRERFKTGIWHDRPLRIGQTTGLANVHGALPVRPDSGSLVAGRKVGARPPEELLSRPVVAIHPPSEIKLPWTIQPSSGNLDRSREKNFLIVPKHIGSELQRPGFGEQTGEERLPQPFPPRFGDRRREATPGEGIPAREVQGGTRTQPVNPTAVSRDVPPQKTSGGPVGIAPAQTGKPNQTLSNKQDHRMPAPTPVPRAAVPENRQQPKADLPGKPANRVFQDNREKEDRRHSQ